MMKANEFIKNFGVHIAKYCLNDCASPGDRWFVHHGALIDGEDFDDLKRLVESHELVGRYGTADEAKEYLPMLRMDSYDELKQAIADVESCQ